MVEILVLSVFTLLQTMDTPRPIDAVDTVFIEELTWMEVRDALTSGKTTAVVATGGIEQNGPFVVTGKHNVVLRATTEAIARKLGNALVAPIIKLVPEGEINGVSLDPSEKAITNGKKLVEYRARITVMAIEKAIASTERP